MRVAVLSDIHGNLLALEAVLADLETAGGADTVVVAGDLCLDGPQPRQTLQRLRALGFPLVQGNTDRDLALDPATTAANEQAALLDWARQELGEDGLAYLRQLPFEHRVQGPEADQSILIVHANPKNQDDPLRPLVPEAQLEPFLDMVPPDVAVVAFGHLHLPFTRRVGRLLLADISSVGLPKDGDRRAGYGLLTWTDEGWSVEQRRVEYPVEEVVGQLRAAAPPGVDELIKMLLRARYPNMAAARGGRAPKRRTPTAGQPIPAPVPDDSEALIVRIGDEAAVDAAAPPVVPERLTSGEPITVQPAGGTSDDAPAPAATSVATSEHVTMTLATPTTPEVELMAEPIPTPAGEPTPEPDATQEAALPSIDDAEPAQDADAAKAEVADATAAVNDVAPSEIAGALTAEAVAATDAGNADGVDDADVLSTPMPGAEVMAGAELVAGVEVPAEEVGEEAAEDVDEETRATEPKQRGHDKRQKKAR
ncbi:MAG TPA: metallophosphoesterase family protein, partial [Thermomicrobiales bacterium]